MLIIIVISVSTFFKAKALEFFITNFLVEDCKESATHGLYKFKPIMKQDFISNACYAVAANDDSCADLQGFKLVKTTWAPTVDMNYFPFKKCVYVAKINL